MATIRVRKKKDGSGPDGKPKYKTVFHVQVRMAGFPARTETFSTRRKAERWAKTVEAEMIEGKHYRSVEARRRTLGDAIDRYIREEVPKKRDAGMHTRTLTWWKSQIGKLKLADITPALIVEHRGKLAAGTYTRGKPSGKRSKYRKGEEPRQIQRKSGTVNRYLRCLGHLFTVCRKEWHWIGHNPMDGVSILREGEGRVRCLSDDERQALLAETAKDPTLHTFVVIALSTACRAGELCKLTWADVDLKNGRLVFRGQTTKNAQGRSAWLHGEALRLLKKHAKVRQLKGGPVFPPSKKGRAYPYAKPFNAAVAAAGIEDLRFHDLRHTAATYLAQAGATEQQLRAIGGWKSGIVSRYVHLAAEDSKEALEKLAGRIDGK